MRTLLYAPALLGTALVIACAPAAAARPFQASSAEAATLKERIADPEIRRVYGGELSSLWDAQSLAELDRILKDAVRHGLDAPSYRQPDGSAGDPMAQDIAATEAALRYASALAHGAVDPTKVHDIFTLERNSVDVAAGLSTALADGRLAAWFEGLAPQDAEYRALSQAYLRQRSAIAPEAGRSIPGGPLIAPGDEDPRVPAIAEALTAEGLMPGWEGEGARYTPDLAEAVRELQRSAGIATDGVVGPDTLKALNAGPFARARRLAVNLERRRWLARRPASERIDVNIAAATLEYVRDGAQAWSTRVVAGAPDHQTPQLGERFAQLVVNPPWYVPQSIAEAEILPRGQDYLESNDMYLRDGRVIQRPGPEAALGQVKFDMQNRYAIYLHDTPAKALFSRAERHRSHGCVRVEEAVDFARRLARNHGVADEFERQLNSGETGVVELGAPVEVRLFYHTAFVQDGQVLYRPDSYGWDDLVAEQLGLGAGEKRAEPDAVTALLGP